MVENPFVTIQLPKCLCPVDMGEAEETQINLKISVLLLKGAIDV